MKIPGLCIIKIVKKWHQISPEAAGGLLLVAMAISTKVWTLYLLEIISTTMTLLTSRQIFLHLRLCSSSSLLTKGTLYFLLCRKLPNTQNAAQSSLMPSLTRSLGSLIFALFWSSKPNFIVILVLQCSLDWKYKYCGNFFPGCMYASHPMLWFEIRHTAAPRRSGKLRATEKSFAGDCLP